jgi:hypothetical protein
LLQPWKLLRYLNTYVDIVNKTIKKEKNYNKI